MENIRHSFTFLRKAPDYLVDNLVQHGLKRTFAPGVQLYWEGDTCSHIAFVTEGEIRVFKASGSGREITLYEIGPGETCILNASCILSGTSYPAHAVTLTNVTALLIPANVFSQLIDEYTVMRTFVFNLLSQRLVTVFELLEDIVFGHLDQRLVDYLIEKAENDTLLTTHQIIAHDLGSSREVISRLLKDMEQKKLVRTDRGKITLLSLGDAQ